jgi:hypothetical protein
MSGKANAVIANGTSIAVGNWKHDGIFIVIDDGDDSNDGLPSIELDIKQARAVITLIEKAIEVEQQIIDELTDAPGGEG